MKVTAFEGVVENGQVRLPVSIRLPEKAKVYVVVPDVEETSAAYTAEQTVARPTLKELLLADTPRAEIPVPPRRQWRRRTPEALE